MHYLVRHSSTDSQSRMLAACLPACRWILVADGWPYSLIMLLIVQRVGIQKPKENSSLWTGDNKRTILKWMVSVIKFHSVLTVVCHTGNDSLFGLVHPPFKIWSETFRNRIGLLCTFVRGRGRSGSQLFSILKTARWTNSNEWMISKVTVVLDNLKCIL